ncbi:MAG: class I SAM-dependent methyltransferase [Actinobacteria bacterium]|nr:class I SAM-dependent methyltransferase [Actinomycetota bacterium]
MSGRARFARSIFAGIAPQYDRMGALLSLGQDARVRRFMVSKVDAVPGELALDVASGTGLVARELAARRNLRVVSLDQSPEMLRAGVGVNREARLDDRIFPVLGTAERLPFAGGVFDAVTFTYLLRYVDDPGRTLAELARVLRPGGTLASLEFHRPEGPLLRGGWWAYTRAVMPLVGAAVSPAWAGTARFLGPNISRFYDEHPLPAQIRWWQDAGLRRVRSRTFFGGAWIAIWGVKER